MVTVAGLMTSGGHFTASYSLHNLPWNRMSPIFSGGRLFLIVMRFELEGCNKLTEHACDPYIKAWVELREVDSVGRSYAEQKNRTCQNGCQKSTSKGPSSVALKEMIQPK